MASKKEIDFLKNIEFPNNLKSNIDFEFLKESYFKRKVKRKLYFCKDIWI